MLKKIIAAGAIFALFACSGKDNDNFEENSSSSQNGAIIPSSSSQEEVVASSSSLEEISSSSEPEPDPGPQIEPIKIASFNNKPSELFYYKDNYGFGFTLKASAKEDLTQFWDTDNSACPITAQQSKPKNCELKDKKVDAILQNTITNQYSDLHYDVVIKDDFISRIGLDSYNLKASGDQAALGLNVGYGTDEGKTIGELSAAKPDLTKLSDIDNFAYIHKGGVHRFRAVASKDADFWEYKVPASADFDVIVIPLSELKGMGSFAGSGAGDGTPFDVSKVTKFLWVVEYDSKVSENNQGSLLVASFEAQKILE